MRQKAKGLLFALSTLAAMQTGAEETLNVLDCRVTGPSKTGERVVEFTIIPPKSSERLSLWTLTEDNRPDQMIKSGVARGEIQVDYGGHSERRDLVFLSVGNTNDASHVAFWLRSGVFQNPNFVIVDIWDPEIPVQVMETVEPQPYLTGNCTQ